MELDTLFIMLGKECNGKCIYCVQHDNVAGASEEYYKKLPTEINPDIIDFIVEQAEHTHEALVRRKAANVYGLQYMSLFFIGGETLLYWDIIKTIIEQVAGRTKNIRYCVITNGLLLTDETADFLNLYNVLVKVSTDGARSEATRGIDVFATKRKRSILSCNNLRLTGVVTPYCYPLELLKSFGEINKEYAKRHSVKMSFRFSHLVYSKGCEGKGLINLDWKRFEDEIFSMIDTCNNGTVITDELYPTFDMYRLLAGYISKGFLTNRTRVYGVCYEDYDTLHMDLAGNLYECHNNTHQLSTIYRPVNDFIRALARLDSGKSEDKCAKCIIRNSCQGICRRGNDIEENCRYLIKYFGSIQNAFWRGLDKYKSLRFFGNLTTDNFRYIE